MNYVKQYNAIMKESANDFNNHEVVKVAQNFDKKLFDMMQDVADGKDVDIKSLVSLTLEVMRKDLEVNELKQQLQQQSYNKTVELIREMQSIIREN